MLLKGFVGKGIVVVVKLGGECCLKECCWAALKNCQSCWGFLEAVGDFTGKRSSTGANLEIVVRRDSRLFFFLNTKTHNQSNL